MRLITAICTSVLLFLTFSLANAQEYPYKLKGFIGIQGGESFTYVLELKDSTNDFVTGFAYTYADEGKDVKATVVGKINRVSKTLDFSETSIIYNRGFTSKAVICLLQSHLTNKEGNLSGKIDTKTAGIGSLPCSSGSISFLSADEIKALFNGYQPKVPKEATPVEPNIAEKPKTPVKITYVNKDSINNARYNQPAPQPKVSKITQGTDKTIEWVSDKIILEVWDGTAVDGDRITITLNGKVVLENYSLRSEKHKLVLETGGNELNVINIIALNEGGDPPNTANITLRDGDKTYDIVAHNHTDKKSVIKIIKKL